MYAADNPGSWLDLHKFVDWFPDDHEHWSLWKPMVLKILSGLEGLGMIPLFRAGQSMHHIIFSTLDHHNLRAEPRVTLEFKPKENLVRVAYSTSNLHFSAPESEASISTDEAVPLIIEYLRRLWISSKPGSPLPAELRAAS